MKARVHVSLKAGVLDPQGSAIQRALSGLGFAGIDSVRQGKFFDIELSAGDAAAAKAELDAACAKLLANPVIESWQIEVLG